MWGEIRRRAVQSSIAVLLASLLGAAAVAHQFATQTFGAVDGLPDPALDPRPASIVGVNVALEQYANLEPVWAWLKPFPWLRQSFAWDQIEPVAGEFDWATTDRLIQGAASNGHSLIAVLGGSPAWARPASGDATAPPA